MGDIARSEIDRLYNYIRRRIVSIEESEDILQDVFLALLTRWNMGERIHDMTAWAFRTAGHKIVDSYRRRRRRTLSLDDRDDLDALDLWQLADASVSTPEEALEREELRAALTEAIDRLPEAQAAVFRLTEIEGLSYRTIAERTGTPLNTLLSRKRYAVLRLREALIRTLGDTKEDTNGR